MCVFGDGQEEGGVREGDRVMEGRLMNTFVVVQKGHDNEVVCPSGQIRSLSTMT